MNEDLYKVVKDYIYESRKSGIKVNPKKNAVTVYASTSALYWIFGILFAGIGIFLLTGGEIPVGLVGLIIGLVFLGGLTKRTVFDIGKNEIRREICFMAMTTTKQHLVSGYHTTIVYVNGRLTGYNFDLEYQGDKDQYGVGHTTMMKGIASFKDPKELRDFQEVVSKILTAMGK